MRERPIPPPAIAVAIPTRIIIGSCESGSDPFAILVIAFGSKIPFVAATESTPPAHPHHHACFLLNEPSVSWGPTRIGSGPSTVFGTVSFVFIEISSILASIANTITNQNHKTHTLIYITKYYSSKKLIILRKLNQLPDKNNIFTSSIHREQKSHHQISVFRLASGKSEPFCAFGSDATARIVHS